MRLWLLIPVSFLWIAVGSAQRVLLDSQPAAAVLPDAPPLMPQSPTRGPGQATLSPNGIAQGYNAGPTINQREEDQSDDQANPAVWKRHLIADRYWVSGQSNFIFQAHGGFRSPYAGANSFQSNVEQTALSRVLTLYTGVKLQRWTEFIFDAEETGGKGLSQTLGLAAFTNLDVVRNPTLSQNVYLARYFIHQTIPLTAGRVDGTAQSLLPADISAAAAH